MNWKTWLKGLSAAAVGGAVTSVVAAVSDPTVLAKPKQLGTVTIAGAAVAVGAYLKQSPIIAPPPPQDPPKS